MRVLTVDLDPWGKPLIELFVAPSIEQARAAIDIGENPGRLQVSTLVDSGASRTLLEKSFIEALNLSRWGETELNTASTGRNPRIAPTYKVRLFVQRVAGELLASDLEVVEADDLSGLRVDMLLGRDVPERCLLFYNGPEKNLTLAFEPGTSDE